MHMPHFCCTRIQRVPSRATCEIRVSAGAHGVHVLGSHSKLAVATLRLLARSHGHDLALSLWHINALVHAANYAAGRQPRLRQPAPLALCRRPYTAWATTAPGHLGTTQQQNTALSQPRPPGRAPVARWRMLARRWSAAPVSTVGPYPPSRAHTRRRPFSPPPLLPRVPPAGKRLHRLRLRLPDRTERSYIGQAAFRSVVPPIAVSGLAGGAIASADFCRHRFSRLLLRPLPPFCGFIATSHARCDMSSPGHFPPSPPHFFPPRCRRLPIFLLLPLPTLHLAIMSTTTCGLTR